ncbi:1-phosphofructokinase family hexose kinase [Neobacillus bataviensis]|uniref:1-phosphofructokinase family hexose kinase n=1 Tax=Neobacillus bataviensis TaxID=220685 RepID=UPI001CBF3864|nr:1-phosphofructokinase family hexose kinase [Neobacillus bataviensis]
MILTITLNPSVDINYQISGFQLGGANRCNSTMKTAGGKGLNVTRVLNCLNLTVKATGFMGGTNGHYIKRELEREGISNSFIPIKEDTRNCIAVLHDLVQTEVMEEGPLIKEEEKITFLKAMEEQFKAASVIVASGSLPLGLPTTFYKELINMAHRFQKPFLLDTSGVAMKESLCSLPTMIKPNISEFEQLIGKTLNSKEELINELKEFPVPVPYIMVTLGDQGAVIKHREQLFRVVIPKIKPINPVGSGDATVAGFAAGLMLGYQGKYLFLRSVLMGLLNTLEIKTGMVNPALILHYEKEIKIHQLN